MKSTSHTLVVFLTSSALLVTSCIVLTMFCLTSVAFAQGVTTAAINGIVTDKTGGTIAGATIIATHEPSGSTYGTSSRDDGRYNIQSLRVGGPYTITVKLIGYKEQKREGVTLELSQNLRMDFSLIEDAVVLSSVEIVGEANPLMSASRTGAATSVSERQIELFPTIARSFTDFMKFTPQFAGNSAASRPNRFNNIQIDGAVNNDLFGLASSGTPGGQAGTTPISLDAIQEFQVVVAPYDVRQGGFTGGGVNAITRSGTNRLTGSAFFTGRNQDWVGTSPDTNKTKYGTFSEYQGAIRIGGPLLENKIFFFVNGELTRKKQPVDIQLGGPGISGSNVSAIPADSVARLTNFLRDQYGYNAGGYDPFAAKQESNKFFIRLDYNISDEHRLTVRNNYVDAWNDNMSRNLTSFFLANSDYVFKSTTNQTVAQLTSSLGNTMSNELIVGYTSIRDRRTTPGAPFPSVQITMVGSSSVTIGSEEYSPANKLDQNILEITDNFSYFMGEHVFTVGTHNEFFNFTNLYIRDFYGRYVFNSLNDFIVGNNPSRYQYSYSIKPGENQPAAQFGVNQFGFYAQDEWTVIPTLKLTLGVRFDIPTFPDKPSFNPKVDSTFYSLGVSTDKLPSGKILFSPRLGFNWDANGDRTTQLRGGLGIFSGRTPYVWISNQYGNTGVDFGRLDVSGSSRTPRFVADPYNQPKPGSSPTLVPIITTEVDLTDPSYKMPQLLRYNIAIDRQLPFGFIGTLEGLYSKILNDVMYQDINLGPQLGLLSGDGRPIYGTYSGRNTTAGQINKAFTNVIYMKNTSKGYQYSITAQLQRQLTDGLFFDGAYTYAKAEDENSVTSSQAISQWRYNPTAGNPNDPGLAPSNFDIRNHIIASLSYRFEYLEKMATTVSFFFNAQSGDPFSYCVDGDINADGQTSNDLVYIPKDMNDIILVKSGSSDTRTVDQIWDQLNTYINDDAYLKDHRGQIMQRNGASTPWSKYLDMRLTQDSPTMEGQNLQITLDILNVLNLINHDWGYSKYVPNQSDLLMRFEGLDAATQKPTYSFKHAPDPYQTSQLSSRWQMQLGIRYSF